MLSDGAAADNWNAWLDDLPLDAGFAQTGELLQDFISGLVAAREAAERERDALREALVQIDALDPEHHLITAFAHSALQGLVLRMGEIARAALKETPK